MEKNIQQIQEFQVKTFRLMAIIGFVLCLGSIFSFIVMNIVLGSSPTIESVYWQRLFVSEITDVLLLPGIIIFALSAILLSWKQYGFFTNRKVIVGQIFVVLIILNTVNITVIEKNATAIAIHQFQAMKEIPAYLVLKNREDMFGALNMLMLLACLIIGIFQPSKEMSSL
jgi:hypothetical protein